jgi:hypothetical protein
VGSQARKKGLFWNVDRASALLRRRKRKCQGRERGGVSTYFDDHVSRLMSAPRMRLSVCGWESAYPGSVSGGLTMTGSMRMREEKRLGNICAARVLGG